MLLDELCTFITTSSTVFARAPSTTRVPIWLGGWNADQPNTAVAFYETGGTPPTYTYDGLEFEQPTIQVISRSTAYTTARTNAWLVYELLAVLGNASLANSSSTGAPTTNYITITPNQSPFDIGSDARSRYQISCNYIVQKALST